MGDGGAVSRRHIRCQRFGTSAAVFRPTTEGRCVAHRNRGLGRDTRSRNGRCHHRCGRRSAGRRDRIAARLLRDDEETRRGSAGRSPEGSPGQRVAPAILETPDKKGGAATANGGNGGDAEPWSLVTGGNVVVFGTIDVTGAPNCPNTGGAGGKGGDASGGGGDRGNGAAGAGGTNATSAQEQAAHPGPRQLPARLAGRSMPEHQCDGEPDEFDSDAEPRSGVTRHLLSPTARCRDERGRRRDELRRCRDRVLRKQSVEGWLVGGPAVRGQPTSVTRRLPGCPGSSRRGGCASSTRSSMPPTQSLLRNSTRT